MIINEESPSYAKSAHLPAALRWREAETEPQQLGKNPLVNLFRGQYSLKRTFWFYGTLWPTLILIAVETIAAGHRHVPQSILWTTLYWSGLFGEYGYSVISIIGLWRSANRYHRSALWRNLAKAYVLLHVVTLSASLLFLLFAAFRAIIRAYP